ncbi:MAG: hypothetical protein FWD69_12635 [Polyangiaceae bacterium]|nr:hypothetical protein [Polyangiaceae bacterium]
MTNEPGRSEPQRVVVERGSILAYRIFDVGATIALDAVEKRVPTARRFETGGPAGLVIPARPLEIALGACDIVVPFLAARLSGYVTAHVFDFGVVSFVYEISLQPGTTFDELVPLCDALYEAAELDEHGSEHRSDLLRRLGDSVEKPHDWSEAETYTVIFVETLGEQEQKPSLEVLARSEIVAKLLLGETSQVPLGRAEREDVVRHTFSYLRDDVVVVDWNSALVIEPNGSRIVPFILELATSQLLEFRYYDKLLDIELARLYEHVGKPGPSMLRSPYRSLTRNVMKRFLELTEFTERIDNTIKVVGDFYLARVYLSAIGRFRVPDWRESVETKLRLVARVYELLKTDVETSRAQFLEIIVIVLILIEVVSALRH